MDKTVIALLSGASALVMVGGAQASPVVDPAGDAKGLQPARTFAELLDPIPNASGLIRADEPTGDAAGKPIEMAQYYHHHHHHHHHHHYRHRYHHHHHHHHYPMMMIPLPGAHG
jgi:hypothetical protein